MVISKNVTFFNWLYLFLQKNYIMYLVTCGSFAKFGSCIKPIPKIMYLFWVKTDLNGLRVHVPEFAIQF